MWFQVFVSNRIHIIVWAHHTVLQQLKRSERSVTADSNFPRWYYNHSDRCMRFLSIVYKMVPWLRSARWKRCVAGNSEWLTLTHWLTTTTTRKWHLVGNLFYVSDVARGDEMHRRFYTTIIKDIPSYQTIIILAVQLNICTHVWNVSPLTYRNRKCGGRWHLPPTLISDRFALLWLERNPRMQASTPSEFSYDGYETFVPTAKSMTSYDIMYDVMYESRVKNVMQNI